jgi:hypothetical protein
MVTQCRATDVLERDKLAATIRAGIDRLNEVYWSKTLNIWFDKPGDDLRAHHEGRLNPPWWPSANAVKLLMDYADATGDHRFEEKVVALYDLQKNRRERAKRLVTELKRRRLWKEKDEAHWQKSQAAWRQPESSGGHYSDFQNEYLDDSGWWGVTWLKMYSRQPDPKYLQTAETIHAHMAKGWKPELGGGVIWCEDEDKQKPNTITNALFLLLSARLHLVTGEPKYLDWAERTQKWFEENAIFDGAGLVDAPGHKDDYWSYNQGVYIGALIALSQASGKKSYLDSAVRIADGVLHRSGLVAPDGVILEKCGTSGDASLFKGVLVRYLGQLRDELRRREILPEFAAEIDARIRISATAILGRVNAEGFYPADWHDGGTNQQTGFNQQVSALTALTAVLPGRYVDLTKLKKSVGK